MNNKKIKTALVAAMLTSTMAYNIPAINATTLTQKSVDNPVLVPTPKKVTYKENILAITNSVNIKGKDVADADAVRELTEFLESNSITVNDDYQEGSLKEMYCYGFFRQKKIELLQDYLDSSSTLEEEDVDFTNDPDGFDLDWEVEKQVSEFQEKLTEKLTGTYQWDDIKVEKFDYSRLQFNLEEYLQQQYNIFSYADEAYDRWRDSQLEEGVTLESILNQPLL